MILLIIRRFILVGPNSKSQSAWLLIPDLIFSGSFLKNANLQKSVHKVSIIMNFLNIMNLLSFNYLKNNIKHLHMVSEKQVVIKEYIRAIVLMGQKI